jgi:CheY-like chemotaxis protein/Tfp pilus assembly protein PilZ
MKHLQYLCVFARASGPRLLAAERLICSLPQLLAPALVECDLLYRTSSQDLVVELCLLPEPFDEPLRARLAFWTARAGGRAMAVSGMGEGDRKTFQLHVVESDLRRVAIAPGSLFEVAGPLFTVAGAPASRRRAAVDRPMLVVEAGGPGWDGVAYEPLLGELFLPSPMAPPLGDEVLLVVRSAGVAKPLGVKARVSGRRSAGAAGPGRPAGFSLRIPDSAPSIRALLGRHAPATTASVRGAPRYPVRAPVQVAPGAASGGPAPCAAPAATISYATDQELEADFVENLSQGGAFVRSATPFPVGATLSLQFRLPNGAELRAEAVVAYVNRDGFGVRFTLDAQGEATLEAAMAHLSARPRRAAVADDDGPYRQRLADALSERGFEVITAPLSGEGLRLVSEELRGLDLLLTDVAVPGRGGEVLVRTLRKAGGKRAPAIVVATSKMSPELERSFEAAGADAVLDKALGPELMAEAADAVLERRRQG